MNEIWQHLEKVRAGHWRKGPPDRRDEVCLIKRWSPFTSEEAFSWKARFLVLDVIKEQFPDRPGFFQFNDAPETTQEEVERVLEKAAIKLDEQVS